MSNLKSELAYFRINLNDKFAEEIRNGLPIPKDAIRHEVENSPFGKLTKDQCEEAIRILESNFTIYQKQGAAVIKDHKPWLQDRRTRNDIDSYYWNRLHNFYSQADILPAHVIARLDNDTDEVLDYTGNPLLAEAGPRRGMVIGHVQSGKTTNYSALICKAADAGYKVIILLAGITNSLRTQTQERIDDTFIGKKSVFGPIAPEALPIQMYAEVKRTPAYGTSRDRDFTRDAAGVGFTLAAHNEPIIFVTKKNKTTLERLRDWLGEQGGGQKLNLPMLLIDDEADNASINTQKDPRRTTAINGVIREILDLFPRSAYVGYTATPFANIFIDPDTNEQMANEDIFPRHFIKALEAPGNYVGAHVVFAETGEADRMVKTVKDYQAILPLSHKKDTPISELPPSLYKAILAFCLTRAIRVHRGQGKKHCSMMINVSRFNDVQEKVLGHVHQYLTEIKNAVTMNAGLSLKKIADPTIKALQETFNEEFSDAGITFEALLKLMPEAVASIQTLTVNMKGGSLDYARHREDGLHVIAIGGLALSRGLTLEGLTVSYILRNTATSDTLMQMARWFGYRPGYEDICRLYLPTESLSYYRDVHQAIEELRSEVKRMQVLEQTPEQFGLRVRQSSLGIQITAANKMRTATRFTAAQNYSSRHIEGHVVPNDATINKANLEATEAFIGKLGAPDLKKHEPYLYWHAVSGDQVMALIKKFRFSDAHAELGLITGDTSLFQDYVSDRLRHDLALWDVVIPQLQSREDPKDFAGHSIAMRSRASGEVRNGSYHVTGDRSRVADPKDAQIGFSKSEIEKALANEDLRGDRRFCALRQRPLLIVHVFYAKADGLAIAEPVISLSFCLPETNVAAVERTYQVNKVYKRQLELLQNEPDDDEPMLEVA